MRIPHVSTVQWIESPTSPSFDRLNRMARHRRSVVLVVDVRCGSDEQLLCCSAIAPAREARHSDSGQTYCLSNVGRTTRLSVQALRTRGNHAPLNQRVPGSSPGAPTKPDQVLLGNSSQNGLFSWETSLIRYEVRSRTELKLLCALSFVSAASCHEIPCADQLVQVTYVLVVD